MEQLDSISDPSDFNGTRAASLAAVDGALRCQVCKDFFDTAMMTSCAHTFCSLCIRQCLSADGKCPTCRAGDQPSKLRRNWVVQEAVQTWKLARAGVLELVRMPEEDVNDDYDDDGRDMREEKRVRKRKARDIEEEEEFRESPTRKNRRQLRSSTRRANEVFVDSGTIVLDSEDDEDDVDFLPEGMGQEQPIDDGLVACPVCSKRMKEEAVYLHLDICPGPSKQPLPPPKPASSGSNGGNSGNSGNSFANRLQGIEQAPVISAPRHLPYLSYALLKDMALRKKLQELDIPAYGPRQLLVKRHTFWVDLYNANCDSVAPRSKRDLLRELDVWERTQGGKAPGGGVIGAGPSTPSSTVMRKDFDGDEWKGKHQDQFKDLIEKARTARREQQAKKEEKKVSESEEKPEPKVNAEPLGNHDAVDEPVSSTEIKHSIHINGEAIGSAPPQIGQQSTPMQNLPSLQASESRIYGLPPPSAELRRDG